MSGRDEAASPRAMAARLVARSAAFGLLFVVAASLDCTPPCQVTDSCPCFADESCDFGDLADCDSYTCVTGVCRLGLASQGTACQAGTGFCNVGGECIKALQPGDACTDDSMCAPSHCVTGVCCLAACDGDCVTCVAPGTVGQCTNLAAGTDPFGDCPGGTCGGSGHCIDGSAVTSVAHRFGPPHEGTLRSLSVTNGRMRIAGWFAEEMYLPKGTLQSPSTHDGFVAQLHSGDGVDHRYSDTSAEATSVVMLASGEYVVAGWYTGDITIGAQLTTNGGAVEGFLAHYEQSGSPTWSRTISGVVNDEECPPQVALGSQNGLVVMFRFNGSFDWAGQEQLSGTGDSLFVGRANPNGFELADTHIFPVTGAATCRLDQGPAANTLAVGRFDGSIEFEEDAPIVSAGATDGWLVRLDHVSTDKRVVTFSSPFAAEVTDVAREPFSSSVVVTGGFIDQLELGSTLSSLAGGDTFVARLDGVGQPEWVKQFGDYNPGMAAVAIDSALHVVHSGMYDGSIDVGGGLRSNGNIYLVKYNADGTHLYDRSFTGESGTRLNVLEIGSQNQIIMAGTFSNTLFLGDDQVSGNQRAIAVIVRNP